MNDSPIINELQRQLKLAADDLHLVFTNDVSSIDLPYYNRALFAIDELNTELTRIKHDHRVRLLKAAANIKT